MGKLYFHGGEEMLSPESVHVFKSENAEFYQIDVTASNSLLPEKAVLLELPFPTQPVRWMAIEHHSPWWCRPVFGEKPSDIPEHTQFLLWQESGGDWGAILPLSGENFSSYISLNNGQPCAILFSMVQGMCECRAPVCVISHGKKPGETIHRCSALASEKLDIPLREQKKYPEIFEYLGWCSWDAMEIWVNEEGLLEKCREFKDKKVPVRWAILDDMWADIAWAKKLPPFTPHSISFGVMHASKMRDFRADPNRFPHGLDGCISSMKQLGLKVGVWHPVNGYWAGIEPNSPADTALKHFTIKTENGAILPDFSSEEKAKGFFETLHRYFADCGAEFVKVDNQSCLRDRYRGVAPVGKLAENLHKALENSVNLNFQGALINCMGMATESVFHRASAVCRCSDDFQPEDRAWFAKHLMQCAFNGLWQGEFYYNDWDMWWTDDGQAKKNSILRAVSGGPIYVSDRAGRTNPELLAPLCFEDGRICRCDGVGVPADDNLLDDPTTSTKAFCVVNSCRNTKEIAAFNIHQENIGVEGSICPIKYGIESDCVLYEHFSKQAVTLKKDESYPFSLSHNDDYRLYLLIPKADRRTVIGLAEKMISPASIVSEDASSVTLREPGILAWYENENVHFAKAGGQFYFN